MAPSRTRCRSARPSDPVPTNPNAHPADAFATQFGPPPAQEATELPPETPNNSDDNPEPATATTTTTTDDDDPSEPSEPSSPTVNASVNAEEGVGARLLHIRNNFNRDTVRQASKAKRTFQKHESNHERFIVWLYANRPQFLVRELREKLDDVSASIDNQSIVQKHCRYVQGGGKKTLQQRMQEHRVKVLREEVKGFLGQPGMKPNRDTVELDALASDFDVFIDYLTEVRKSNGGLPRSGAYCALRSSYIYLFRRYRYTVSREFEDDLRAAMDGVKRITNMASQFGEGNLWDGDQPLPWGLYQQHVAAKTPKGRDREIWAMKWSSVLREFYKRKKNTEASTSSNYLIVRLG